MSSHQFLVSDGIGPYISSSVDISPGQQWTPPVVQEISNDEYGTSSREVVLRPLYYSPAIEGTSVTRNRRDSTSSRSDSRYDYEPMANKLHPSSQRNRRCFMPKAIHPLSLSSPSRETNNDTTLQRDGHSSSSNLNFAEAPALYRDPADRFWCSLCERLLSQRSPWGSHRIIKSRDMPITGVLACCHVFHAECLDQTTPKSNRNDPPCPVCARDKEESTPKSRNVWGCVQAGDCIEGALHGPSRNALVSVKLRKNLSGQDFTRKLM